MRVWSTTFTESILPYIYQGKKVISNFDLFKDRILILWAARLLRLQSSLGAWHLSAIDKLM